jgi:hypothetical protein
LKAIRILKTALPLIAAAFILSCTIRSGDTGSDGPITPQPAPSPTFGVDKPVDEPLPAPTLTPVSGRTLAADLIDLRTALEKAVDAYPVSGKYAVAVTDLQTGETVGVDGDTLRLSGCTINLFVLFQVAVDLEAGKYSRERVDALVRSTIWSSNAVTAFGLYQVVGDGDATRGVGVVAELIERLALEGLVLDHPPGYPEHSLGRDSNNWVTAEAMNAALAAFWRGDVVGQEYRDWLLERLTAVKPGLNYLTAAVPTGKVSHKNGFFLGDTGYVDNDAGIIRLASGQTEYAYAVTFLSQEVPREYGDVVLGQKLGRLAHEVMARRAAARLTPTASP